MADRWRLRLVLTRAQPVRAVVPPPEVARVLALEGQPEAEPVALQLGGAVTPLVLEIEEPEE